MSQNIMIGTAELIVCEEGKNVYFAMKLMLKWSKKKVKTCSVNLS